MPRWSKNSKAATSYARIPTDWERISETQSINSTAMTSFYGYDGHVSVRRLFSSTGAITDTYDYDAFGNLIASTGTTPNNYLFAGERFDPALGLYCKRPTPPILVII